jgi:hypothetical protein
MELKVICDCGQKYKFDVEPVAGRMPFTVNCPVCGVDGTATANVTLAGQLSVAPPPPIVPSGGGLRINRHEPAPTTTAATPPSLPSAAKPIAPIKPLPAAKPKKTESYSMGMGVLGALLGAGVGAGLMYGFFAMSGFRFPLMGTAIGILCGYGARLLAKGTDMTLGVLAAVLAFVANGATLYFMFGDFSIFFILSLIIGASFAYRIAS